MENQLKIMNQNAAPRKATRFRNCLEWTKDILLWIATLFLLISTIPQYKVASLNTDLSRATGEKITETSESIQTYVLVQFICSLISASAIVIREIGKSLMVKYRSRIDAVIQVHVQAQSDAPA